MGDREGRADGVVSQLTPAQRLQLSLIGALGFAPVHGKLWLQKEMFVLMKGLPDVQSPGSFDAAPMGPLSEIVDWDLDQLQSVGLVEVSPGSVELSDEGKALYPALGDVVSLRARQLAAEVKSLLNDLTKDELLAFIYFRFPETTGESVELEKIIPRRVELAVSLVSKGKTGLEGGARVAGLSVQEFARRLKAASVPIFSQ